MKIIWLAHEGNMSGANICMLEYLSILQKKGIENYLVIPFGYGDLSKRAEELKILVFPIKYYSWARPMQAPPSKISIRLRQAWRNFIAVKKIGALIKKIEPDFVATNTVVMNVGAMAAKKAGKKHIWFVHEFGEEDHGFTIDGGFAKGATVMERLSYRLVFNSQAVKNKYHPFVPGKKAFIVNNAVLIREVEMPQYEMGDVLQLIMLGQVAPAKNILEALHALKICTDCSLKFKLHIVGKAEDNGYQGQLRDYITNEGLSDLIQIIGQNMDPVSLLQQHHALLMCSRNEAFGRVTVEALKCGLPVIGAATGGTVEIIEDGINGYLYKAGDAAALAEKIMLLHENYQRFNKAAIAKQTRKKYNEANTGLQLINVFA